MRGIDRRAAMALVAGAAACPTTAWAGAEGARELPSLFHEHMIFVTPTTTGGERLKFYTDTGGGLFMLRPVADRLGLSARGRLEKSDEGEALMVPFPEFRADGWIPPTRDGEIAAIAMDPAQHGEFARRMIGDGWSGLLGQRWFEDRIWTFDYPGRRLLLHETAPAAPAGAAIAPLHFQMRRGKRSTAFPRIQAQVAGETLDLLFDTGAHGPLTPEAVAVMGGAADVRATSFITLSVLNRWRAAHPDWRYVEKGERGSGAPLIEAPSLRIAGLDAGPVWFTGRADRNFTEWMSQWTDRPITGALGGNAMRRFRVTADYPAARATLVAA